MKTFIAPEKNEGIWPIKGKFLSRNRLPAAMAAIGLLGLLAGGAYYAAKPDPQRLGAEVRLEATSMFRVLQPEDYPAPIENDGADDRIWAVRKNAAMSSLDPVFIAAAQLIEDAPIIAKRSLQGEGFPAQASLAGQRAKKSTILSPLLYQDGATQPGLFAALPYGFGDALDVRGKPLRWHLPKNVLAGYRLLPPAGTEPKEKKEAKETAVAEKPKLPRFPSGAAHYRELVENFAKRYNLSVELVMAIIHSESDFSPSLVSRKSAMGLMQLLPSTASDEVHRFLYGRRGNVSFEQLSVPEINIRYGTAYLHILRNRYFQNVANKGVQEHCVVASYNLGPNRFLRLYGATNEKAVEKINSMTPEEFYQDLPRRLPTRETRYYVEKVRRMKNHYSLSR